MSVSTLSLRALGRAYRDGSLTPLVAAKQYLARIERLDPTLKAFTRVTEARALAEAEAATAAFARGEDRGPLQGIPYAVKDHFDVAGVATMAGCSLLKDNIAEQDCAAVAKLTEAGMVLLGKCHTVQFAGGITGINQDLGTPHNPWKEEHHVPGGSSSGSGVAVAGGLAPVTLGGDTGGSVRVPAALCGVVGLKTTLGRIGRSGVFPMAPTLDTVGVLGGCVEDVALVYQTLHGPEPGDETTLGHPEHDVMSGLGAGVEGSRILVPTNVLFDDCDPEVEQAVRAAAEALASLGAVLVERRVPELDIVRTMPNRFALVAVETYVSCKELVDNHESELDPLVAWMTAGKRVMASTYREALMLHAALKREILTSLQDVDAVLGPTTLLPALPLETVAPDLGRYQETYRDDPSERYTRNASLANLLGLCGISVPCGLTGEGLPIGLQILAKPFREDVALKIAAAFEADHIAKNGFARPDWIESLVS